jgi:hypothetical protein
MIFDIWLSDALEIYNSNAGTFNISYRKSDGSFGEKKNVRRQASKSTKEKTTGGASTKRLGSFASKLNLVDEKGQRFEIWICLWLSINNKLIDKRY